MDFTFMKIEFIDLPNSKSYFIRWLILNFIYNNKIIEIDSTESNDVKVVHRALCTLQKHKKSNEYIHIPMEDCGSGYRFITTLAAAWPGKWHLTGTPRLLERPITPLIQTLQQVGALIHTSTDGLWIQGKTLTPSEITIDCSISSQLASSILLSAPLLHNPKIKICSNTNNSISYLQMTQNMILNKLWENNKIEKDWSAALFWYAYVLLHSSTTLHINGLSPLDIQPDVKIFEWFKNWGINSIFDPTGVLIYNPQKQEIPHQTINLQNNIDAAPILSVLALLYPFTLTLTGIEHLNFKESKRKEILLNTISNFTIVEEHNNHSITIYKREKELPQTLHLSSHNDHRFVMAWTLFHHFLEINIDDKTCVLKSYPQFFEELKKMEKNFQRTSKN